MGSGASAEVGVAVGAEVALGVHADAGGSLSAGGRCRNGGNASQHARLTVEALEVVEVVVDGGRGRIDVAVANRLVDGAVLGVDLRRASSRGMMVSFRRGWTIACSAASGPISTRFWA